MRRLAAGFVVSVLVLACSLCSANTLSDQEIIERTFQTFVEGMQELDIAKVPSVLADRSYWMESLGEIRACTASGTAIR